MGSLNPFSQFIVREMIEGADKNEKLWELDEAIFNKPAGEVKKEHLIKSSSEMFAIYKFTNDPRMIVRSSKYTNGEFIECRHLLPQEESVFFETSILNDIKA